MHARDNICTLAEAYVTVRAERSLFFGPDGDYEIRSNGTTANNLNSDFFYQRINNAGTLEKLLDEAPPHGPRREVKEIVSGYVAGYNRYLRETGVANLTDASCEGAEWVRPITELDAYRRIYQLILRASSGVAVDSIATAQPPTAPLTGGAVAGEREAMHQQLATSMASSGLGSNAYGLGARATQTGYGMVLANPHFPWDGPERLYQLQLTIPNKINVSGATVFGAPLVLIGHTERLAWSHTVSSARRFTVFELKLVAGSPTTYLYEGRPQRMKADTVTVRARRADGTVEDRTRTLYSSNHGPILTSILGQPVFPWTTETAFALGDANATNFRAINHFFETNHAQSVGELDMILRRNQGLPWVHTIAADSDGKAYYADISVVPNVPDAKAAECNTALGRALDQAARLYVLDGSVSRCEWGNDPDTLQPGIFGPSHLPLLVRDDYVANANDSHWLSNPLERLEGYARIIGTERTARSPRTRLGLRILQQRLDGSDFAAGTGFTLRQLQDAVFNNRQFLGELWRDQLVAMCRSNPVLLGSTGPVDVSEACPVLENWDLHNDLDSHGALLFSRFAGRAISATGGPYATAFSNDDPVGTPRDLRTEHPQVQRALADAVTDVRRLEQNPDRLAARLRDFQYEPRGAEKIAIHGGPAAEGVFNAITANWIDGKGYADVVHGSSFVMAASLVPSCPDVRILLTYSQSANPSSPYFSDQTRMFSGKEWVKARFCENDIRTAPGLRVERIAEPR